MGSAVGAGDTFVAGILYRLVATDGRERNTELEVDDDGARNAIAFAVDLATRKIQMDGFRGLA
jgi:sugar/nucleoside kinase (ribokinase family)